MSRIEITDETTGTKISENVVLTYSKNNKFPNNEYVSNMVMVSSKHTEMITKHNALRTHEQTFVCVPNTKSHGNFTYIPVTVTDYE